MRDVNTADGIVPLADFKTNADHFLKQLSSGGEPIVLTQNGRPAAVIISPEAFEEMRERQRFLEAVAAGLADAEAGRVVDHAKVEQWLQSWGADDEREPPQCE